MTAHVNKYTQVHNIVIHVEKSTQFTTHPTKLQKSDINVIMPRSVGRKTAFNLYMCP